ncbi:hypothetical protein DICPUDRAFT_146515 [Dictyostelium purpureum]|uniref:Uncharacterized protein n=1 Tax=Dictyostelium purpureum TaxID=5786 RepID=F0Z662_DICPU|nr:uncharacterized protein DICPUDRAFT_146515 [Dictyostelium purpureum]EGC40600.1 hypothetical protein DICPUDRAFT_146515 [Dictyostelium purpureum]|eukprot:XP_003282936.1 hypothetical protein DICPUDRAFT_146515 [Dictyostelium purpureum]
MVRIITRRSSHLQKRNRVQLCNLNQVLYGSSNCRKTSNNMNIRKKVLKSKDIPKIKKEPNVTTTLIPTKIAIITRSSKINPILNNFNYNVKEEPQTNNCGDNNKSSVSSQKPKPKSKPIITKISIVTRSNIKKNREFIKNYNKLFKI